MAISKFFHRFRIYKFSVFTPFSLVRRKFCSVATDFVNPDEIGNLSFKFDDRRVSNLLSRYRSQFEDTSAKRISLTDDHLDFLNRLFAIEGKIFEVDRQLEELRKNFPDCPPTERVVEIETTDSELATLVDEDRRTLNDDRRRLEDSFLSELAVWLLRTRTDFTKTMPTDLIMELSAGVGGQEAMLFTKEIFDMYRRYADYRQWKFDVLEEQTTDLNGIHFASVAISGPDAYSRLRFEGGVHRVQRVPVTERSGSRVHTSTMSVAILAQPHPDNEKNKINMKEFKFETFRACAPGGQNVNKSDSGSRITHLPTGITVSCQIERRVDANRDWALRRIMAILYERRMDGQRGLIEQSRKLQVGSLARSEKIRTYNYQQDRVTDHRTKQNFLGIPDILSGGDALNRIVEDMQRFHLEERLSEALDEEEKETKANETIRKAG